MEKFSMTYIFQIAIQENLTERRQNGIFNKIPKKKNENGSSGRSKTKTKVALKKSRLWTTLIVTTRTKPIHTKTPPFFRSKNLQTL